MYPVSTYGWVLFWQTPTGTTCANAALILGRYDSLIDIVSLSSSWERTMVPWVAKVPLAASARMSFCVKVKSSDQVQRREEEEERT